MIDKITRTW